MSRVDGLAGQATTLESLCGQLARAHGLRGTLPDSTVRLVELYRLLLHRPRPDSSPLVVVIDGLDEADAWSPAPGSWLAESPLPTGVHVVLAAREIADTDWPEILGLRAGRSRTHVMLGLSPDDTREMMRAAGGEGAARADEAGFAERLTMVAGGDPYYVRLLVDDVVARRLDSVEDLGERHRDLNRYFKDWWGELSAAAAGSAAEVRDLLGYLLISEWPVPRDDLVAVSSEDALDSFRIGPAIAAVKRHLVGDEERGYALSHARFREELNRSIVTPEDQETYRSRMLAYGARWQERRSPFILERYAALLAQAGYEEKLLTLVQDPQWVEAKTGYDPSGASLRQDLDRALKAAAQRDREAVDTAGSPPLLLEEVGIALTEATMAGFAGKLPHQLLKTLLVTGSFSDVQALAVVRAMPDANRQALALEEIAPVLSADGLLVAAETAQSLPDRASSGFEHPRPRALAALGKRSGRDEQLGAAIIDSAYAARRPMADDEDWLRIVVRNLAVSLTPEQLLGATDVAAAVSANAEDVAAIAAALVAALGLEPALDILCANAPKLAGSALLAIADAAEDCVPDAVIARACRLPFADSDGYCPRGEVLVALAQRLSSVQRETARQAAGEIRDRAWRLWTCANLGSSDAGGGRDAEALADEARELPDAAWRANALAVIAPSLSDPSGVAAEALSAATSIEDPHQKAPVLMRVVGLLHPAELQRALDIALTLPMADPLQAVAVAAITRLPEPDRDPAIERSIAAVLGLPGHASSRAEAAARLAELLPPPRREGAIRDLIARVAEDNAYGLAALAPWLGEQTWEQCIETVESLTRTGADVRVITTLAAVAPAGARERLCEVALRTAREQPAHSHDVYEVSPRAEALASLIDLLPREELPGVVDEALAALRVVDDAGDRVALLAELLPALMKERRAAAMDLVRLVTMEERPEALIRLLVRADNDEAADLWGLIEELSPPERMRVLAQVASAGLDGVATRAREALEATMSDLQDSAAVLIDLADILPEDFLSGAVAHLTQNWDETEVANVVVALAGRFDRKALHNALRILDARLSRDIVVHEGTKIVPREWVIRNLLPYLRPDDAEAALAVADHIADGPARVRTRLLLAPILSGRTRRKVLRAAVRELDREHDVDAAFELARLLLPHQSGADAERTTDAALAGLAVFFQHSDTGQVAQRLLAIVPVLPPSRIQAALDLAADLPGDLGACARAAVIGRIDESERGTSAEHEADEAIRIGDPELRWRAIVTLGTAVPAAARPQAIRAAVNAAMNFDGVGSEMAATALAALKLSRDERLAMLREELDAAISGRPPLSPHNTTESMSTGPVVSPASGLEALVGKPILAPRTMLDGRVGIERLDTRMVSYLLPGAGGTVEFHNDRFDQLPAAEHVELVSQAIRRVGAVDPEGLATALAPLAPHLPLDTLPMLVAERPPGSDWQRALAIAILAPPLPRWMLPKPLQPRVRARFTRERLVLVALGPAIARLPGPQRYELIGRTLEVCARQFRPYALIGLEPIIGTIAYVGGDGTADEIARRLLEIGEWWP